MKMLKLVGVASVLIIDLVLLVAVLRTDVGTADARQGATVAQTPGVSQDSPGTLEPTGAMTLTLGGDGVLFRFAQGSCTGTGRPKLEISGDVGGSFSEVALPLVGERVVPVILAVDSTSQEDLSLLATDAQCNPVAFTTDDRGGSWQEAAVPDDVWYVGPDRTTVVSPDGESDSGCSINSFTTYGATDARVLCDDGEVRGTSDSGTTWVGLGELADSVAATFPGIRNSFAVTRVADCQSTAMSSRDAGASWTPLGCIDDEASIDVMVGTPSRLIASDGEKTWVSLDDGQTWEVSQRDDEEDSDEDEA